MRSILIIIAIILVIVLICALLPWFILLAGYWVSETPDKPEITYEEFPFKLVYEINGEEIIINDTLICSYDGIGISEASGKVRKWKSILKSGDEKLVLVTNDNVCIYYDVGPASYYMGDYNDVYYPNAMCETKYKNDITSNELISNNELLNKYGIVIKSWSIKPPIQNNFK